MTKAKRENPRRFIPTAGGTYENAGGGTYLCTCLAGVTQRDAWMRNTASGWTLLAHGIVRYEDGTIEWDYSTGGHFENAPEEERAAEIRQRQRSLVNAMLCCMI